MWQGFDIVLCLGLLGLAWGTVQSRGLFRCVVLFMAFGLLMAVAWARSDAPDLALAEAIIGAGITGALLLNACQGMGINRPAAVVDRRQRAPALPRPLLACVCALLGVLLAGLFTSLHPVRSTAVVADQALGDHVMGNPVTAVLLDYRGYDTLLEMAVLLLALLGGRLLNLQGRLPELYPVDAPRSPLLDPLAAIMIPVTLLMGGYLYWAGSTRPGGAFQAGALLGAVGILLRLSGRLVAEDRQRWPLRGLLALGLAVFTLYALSSIDRWGHALAYPPGGGYYLMVAIEGCLTLSIALTLVLLVADAPGVRLRRSR